MLTSVRYRERSVAVEEDIGAAFRFENELAPYLIYDANYWLFGELPEKIPPDYCDADPGSMIDYQTRKIDRHVAADFNVADRYIEEYYHKLFEKMGTRGLIVAAYIAPAITLSGGKYNGAQRDPGQTGKAIEQAIKKYNVAADP